MSNVRYTYTHPKITAQIVDESNHFNWLCFAKESGVCRIKKVSGTDLSQTYYDFTKSVDNINRGTYDDNNLYLAYEDDTLFGEIIDLNNPLTVNTTISFPGGIVESPVDVRVDGSNLYFLTPGVASGTVANVIVYNTSGVFQEIVELEVSGVTEINNASSFEVADNGDLWIVTNETPAKYIRLNEDSIGWQFEVYELS